MSGRKLMDGASSTATNQSVEFKVKRQRFASIYGTNLTTDITVDLKAGDAWVTVATLSSSQESVGVYAPGDYRVNNAAALPATTEIWMDQ